MKSRVGQITRVVSMAFLLCIFIVYGGIKLFAQPATFSHYTVKDGISQSEIKCLFQDSEGFIWFGTQNGLNRFDGYTFKNYFNDPADISTLSSNWIFAIAEDSSGYIWIGTKRGLNRFDKKTGDFDVVDHKLPGSRINDVFVYGLAYSGSSLYINTPPDLSVLNVRTGHLETFAGEGEYEGILYDFGYPVIRSRNGRMWTGSEYGLGCFDPHTGTYSRYVHDPDDPYSISDNRITALYEERSGKILAGTVNGLNILDNTSGRFACLVHDDRNPNSLSSNFVRSITQDPSGILWIGTEEGGLNKVTLHSQGNPDDFVRYRNIPNNPNCISHDIVYSLLTDRSNNLWIGTIAGLDKIDLKKKKFRHYKKTEDPSSPDLLDNVIGSIYQDDDGILWIGNWNKGLNIMDRERGTVQHYSMSMTGRLHLPDDHVHVIFRDGRDRIWLGTRNGVCVFDRATGAFIPFQQVFGVEDSGYFNGNRVYCILSDSGGDIWIGTGNGIFVLDTETRQTRIIRARGDGYARLSNNLVYSLLEDRNERIWIATSNGLDRYDPEDGRIIHFLRDPDEVNTLCDNYAIALCEDSRGNIWIGTNTGAARFNPVDSVFTCYTLKDGMPSNIVYDILEDDDRNLWFTTGNGLVRYHTATGTLRAYTLEEGVQGMEFNIKALCKGKDGELFFGGMDGFISFFPDSLRDNEYLPPLKITSFEKENNGIRSRLSVYNEPIRLSYHDYSFTIEFSALDFSDPLKNRYAYQMEPLSGKWIDVGNRRFVHFTNLPPGSYVFRVKGTNNDGIWSDSIASIRIRIDPPWWKSRYALAAYIVLAVTAVLVFIRWRIKSLVKEKKMLEQKVRERTDEIVRQKDKLDELNTTKDKFFSILAHDLKGPFSSLYSMSESLSGNYSTLEEPDRRTGLEKIHSLAILIYRLIENLLTWSRSQRGGITFTPVRFSLTQVAEVNVNLHRTAATQKNIRLHNTVGGDLYAFGDPEMINTVMRNLVSNAVKFTPGGKAVEASVTVSDDFLEVTVRDEGVGISEENMKKLFRIDVKYKTSGTAGEAGTGLGLVLCREFVEKNGGAIWCESREGEGTVFHFTVPRFKEDTQTSDSKPEGETA